MVLMSFFIVSSTIIAQLPTQITVSSNFVCTKKRRFRCSTPIIQKHAIPDSASLVSERFEANKLREGGNTKQDNTETQLYYGI